MLKKLLFLGAFLLPTLGMAASDTDLSEPESSSAIESTESGGYYGDYRRGPGCDDDYRRVYPPHHPPRYPAPYPPRYPIQNPKNCVNSLKEISTAVPEILVQEVLATGITTTTSVVQQLKELAVHVLEILDPASSVVDVSMTSDSEVVEIDVSRM